MEIEFRNMHNWKSKSRNSKMRRSILCVAIDTSMNCRQIKNSIRAKVSCEDGVKIETHVKHHYTTKFTFSLNQHSHIARTGTTRLKPFIICPTEIHCRINYKPCAKRECEKVMRKTSSHTSPTAQHTKPMQHYDHSSWYI